MLNTNFPPWPSFSEEEIECASRVLASNRVNYWTGEEGRALEKEYAETIGAGYAVAAFNGTVALEIALRAAGLQSGDEVVVTPRSFFASVASVVNMGCVPVFADVDRDSQNLTAQTIAPVLSARTRAILLVHLAGMPCDMDPILELADAHRLVVIEDCAQAHGATYKGRSVGTFGAANAWSFCQDKIITTAGEGGMLTTNDAQCWQRMWSLKDHGKSWRAVYETDYAAGFRWLHESFGTNARMLEVQAAIARIQLKRLPEWSQIRRHYACAIWDAARRCAAARVPIVPDVVKHGAYRAYVFAEPAALRSDWDRDRIVGEITRRGVPCYVGSCPEIYLEKAFDNTPWRPAERLRIARELGETGLCFLVHPTLRAKDIELTCEVLTTVFTEALR